MRLHDDAEKAGEAPSEKSARRATIRYKSASCDEGECDGEDGGKMFGGGGGGRWGIFGADENTLGMREQPPFPYFVPTPKRPLRPAERSVLERLLESVSSEYRAQAEDLLVVGRCGCGKCPTVFFEPHIKGDVESDLVSYIGRDSSGGAVGVHLFEKAGRLSQLEFFSADGHDPWGIPAADTLEAY